MGSILLGWWLNPMGYWSHELEISSTISIQEKKTTEKEKKLKVTEKEISLLLEFGQSHEQEPRFYMMSSSLFQTFSLWSLNKAHSSSSQCIHHEEPDPSTLQFKPKVLNGSLFFAFCQYLLPWCSWFVFRAPTAKNLSSLFWEIKQPSISPPISLQLYISDGRKHFRRFPCMPKCMKPY